MCVGEHPRLRQPETAGKMISVRSWPPAPPCASLARVPGLITWREHTMPPRAAAGTTELEFPLSVWRREHEMSVSLLSFASVRLMRRS